jgi:hypothetical protein
VRPLEKIIAAVVLIGSATFAGYAYLSVAAENKREFSEAAAAGFASYGDLREAKAAGISDAAAWAEHKRQAKAEGDAQRDRIAAARADMAAKAAKSADEDLAMRRELARDPTTKMHVKSFTWKKGGFGSVGLVTVEIAVMRFALTMAMHFA